LIRGIKIFKADLNFIFLQFQTHLVGDLMVMPSSRGIIVIISNVIAVYAVPLPHNPNPSHLISSDPIPFNLVLPAKRTVCSALFVCFPLIKSAFTVAVGYI